MIVSNPKTSNILLILVSNDKAQARTLMRDMQGSKYVYDFLHVADAASLLSDVQARIARGTRSPVVLVINFQFAGAECETLLRIAREAQQFMAIECVVTHVPQGDKARGRLLGLGARLVDGNASEMPMELTLH